MKFSFQWNDPDFYNYLHFDREWLALSAKEKQEQHRRLEAIGIGEYLRVEVDTDTGVVEVRRG